MPRVSSGAKTLSGYRMRVSPATSDALTIRPNLSGGAVGGVSRASGPECRDNASLCASTASGAATELGMQPRTGDLFLMFTQTHSSAARNDTLTAASPGLTGQSRGTSEQAAVNRRTAGSIRRCLNESVDGDKR